MLCQKGGVIWGGVSLNQFLKLLMFLPAILIPVSASSSTTFHMYSYTYSAYKLNKHGDNIQAWWTPSPIWHQSVALTILFLTTASWPAYTFPRRQVRWSGIPSTWRIFQFVMIHTIKGFGIVSKAEVVAFLAISCLFYDPTDVDNLISGSSAFSKSNLNI